MFQSPRPLSDLAALRAYLHQQPAANAYLLGWMAVHGTWGQSFEFRATREARRITGVVLSIDGGTYGLSHGTREAGATIGRFIQARRGPLSTLIGPSDAANACRQELDEPNNAIVIPQLTYRLEGLTAMPHVPELRKATAYDTSALVAAGLMMHAEEAGQPIPEAEQPNYRASVSLKIKSGRVWVVRDPYTDALVFKAAIAPPSTMVALLEGIWVAPAYRRRGLGLRYVAALCQSLVVHHRQLALQVNIDNLGARALYERLGFRPEGPFTYALYTR